MTRTPGSVALGTVCDTGETENNNNNTAVRQDVAIEIPAKKGTSIKRQIDDGIGLITNSSRNNNKY
jgi:hypothetical protein